MAEEAILTVSLKDYKKQIDDLRASLLSLDSTSKEYQATAEEIKNKQAKLNEVMGVGKQSVNAVAGSYNALSQELSNLKKEWKNMEIGTEEWKNTAKQIDDLNNKLKDADSKVGVYGRNVGNYSQSFVDAFNMVGGSAGKMGASIVTSAKSAGVALKALAANPIVAVIAAVALVVNGLVQAFKRNEAATASLKKAMAPLQAALTVVQKGFDFLATSIGKAAEAIGNFFNKVMGSDSATAKITKDLQAIADAELQLAQQQRETTMKNADAANEVAELRYKAAQKTKYTEEERLQFLTEAGEKEKEIAKRAYEDLKLQYEIIKKKNSLTESTAEEKKAEADAYAAMVQAETNYFNKTKEIETQISEIRNKGLEKVKEILKKVKESSQTEIQNLTDKYNKEKKLLEKYGKDTVLLTEQYEKDVTKVKAKEWQERLRQEQTYQDIYLSQFVAGSSSYYEAQLQGLYNTYNDFKAKETEIENSIKDSNAVSQEAIDKIYQNNNFNSRADFQKSMNDALMAVISARDNLQKALEKEFNTRTEIKLLDLGDRGEAQKLQLLYREYVKFYAGLKQLSEESDEDFALRKKQWEKTIADTLAQIPVISSEQNRLIKEQKERFKEVKDYVDSMPHSNFEKLFSIPKGEEERLAKQFADAEDRLEEWQRFKNYYKQENIVDYGIKIGIDLSGLDRNSEEFKAEFEKLKEQIPEDTLSKLLKLPSDVFEKNIQLLEEYADAEAAILEQRRNNFFNLAGGVADCFNAIADIQKANIEAEKENLIAQGKTEEEANALLEDKFEQSKRFQIAASVIQTISGAIAAFMSCQELGFPWGTIIGAVQAAAVTAAGVAQIKQIQNTKIGSNASINGNYSTATPKLNDYNPNRVQNITSASDEQKLQDTLSKTNIWVSVSDIDNAQNKNQVRVAESSF